MVAAHPPDRENRRFCAKFFRRCEKAYHMETGMPDSAAGRTIYGLKPLGVQSSEAPDSTMRCNYAQVLLLYGAAESPTINYAAFA